MFGYDNVEVPGPDGKRAYVARRVNEAEAAIVKQLATVERDLVRLTAAVTAGGELDTLVAAIKEREKAREALRLELRSLERAGRAATLDLPAVERQLRAKLDEWKAVLRKHVPQARQVLKKLLAGPLVFTAHREAGGALLRVLWADAIGRIISGLACANMVASPAGPGPFSTPDPSRLRGRAVRVA